MKAIELKDILNYQFLSEPRFSPDGSRAAFVVSRADEEENSYESRLWLWDESGLRPLTDLGKERDYVWLDENRLLFPAARSAAEKKKAEAGDAFTAYYALDLRGGEAMPLFTLPFAVKGLKVLDATHFAVAALIDKTEPELWQADEEDRAAAKKRREENKDYEVFDELPFWLNGAGVTNGRRGRLFLVSLDPLTITPVSDPAEDLAAVSLLGEELFYAATPRGPKLALKGFSLRAVNWKTGAARPVLENKDLSLAGMEAVGDELWLMATAAERYGLNENCWVYRVNPADGALSLLRQEEYSLYNSVGSDVRFGGGRDMAAADGSLYHLTTREGNCFLHRLDADGTDHPVVTRPGSLDLFDVHGGRALAVGLYDMQPQELYLCDLVSGEMRQLSRFNREALEGRYVAQPRRLTVQSEGLEIEGWVLPPIDFDPEKRYPAVLDIHGGPKTVYGPVFYHEMQLWAGMGYFVFFCNPKGSDGRDNAFADIRGAYGATDYQNLMDFTDAVLAAWPQIDPARVCETGGSYGGFMTNWIIGHTDRFCCAASQRSISNWLSFYGVSDIGFFFASDQTGGTPWREPEKLWAQSPLKYADRVHTPTLFIHADEDYRCPADQGLQMLAALLDHGVEARLCLFHGENHELSRSGKPKHRLRRLREITDWFEKHSK